MNFLSKTFNSLTGFSIPYTFKEKLVDPSIDSNHIWTIYSGTNPKDNSDITIFEFNLKDERNLRCNYDLLARNSFKKLKMIKFPEIVNAIDFIENENFLYIVTEAVVPFIDYVTSYSDRLSVDNKVYGIHNVGRCLEFINMKCNCVHGNLNLFNSIFVNKEGDWKLFGFELLTNLQSDPDQPIYRNSNILPTFSQNLPNDVKNQGLDSIRQFPLKFDSYLFGAFIYSVLVTEDWAHPRNLTNIELLNSSGIPTQILNILKRLVSAKPNLRISIDKVLDDKLFSSNKLIKLNEDLKFIQFKDNSDKLDFFKYNLSEYFSDNADSDNFPVGFLENKLLPQLAAQYRFIENIKPSVNSTAEEFQKNQEALSILLNYILRSGNSLKPQEFDKIVKPIIFRSFSSNDRSLRLILLNNLGSFHDKLSESEIQSKIFYNVVSGFQDTNFMIRETTLTSITQIVDKISVKQINQDLLKILAKSQIDPKPSIRTNTLVLIVKVHDKIYKTSKNSVIISALSKSLRDTFTPCKMMALSGFEKLIDEFSLDEICNKVLGQLAVSLMDNRSSKVREEAKRVFKLYLASVEKHAATLPSIEEDEEEEEKQFFKKYAPNVNDKDSHILNETSKSDTFSFGWNVVNRLVTTSAIEGQLNHDFNNSTPDLLRTNSGISSGPGSRNTSTTEVNQVPKEKNINSFDTTWNNDHQEDVEDGWGIEDDDQNFDNDLKAADNQMKNVNIRPNVNVNPSTATNKTKIRPATDNARKGSSLKLGKPDKKPGSTLKLDLKVEEDSWGNDADDW